MLKTLKFLAIILALGLVLPAHGIIPVKNATAKDWNRLSFWYAPWGKSGVHKGIDIFAKLGTPVISSTSGLVIYTGHIEMGGNVVVVLGPKWRIYYYSHLDGIHIKTFDWATSGKGIGTVGDSGNAAGKPPHLHYSVMSLVPYPWKLSAQTQGWKKMFFMNPAESFG
ncbi:M23 family metallopeptidase [Methylotenera sp.]|uniref:M23 family metallopeptidase n=1 Tax=Methylotenera sp. TaxID=2051956 RepID=UPI002731E466|nr:M23 family metallopeptidase [Methylotenera sp.]MDP2070940.1 M23 family metallopeptidase [Methylotenera sp.]MDP3005814.1 M23 family metallopeptidase [Methylotenera sp.]